MVDRKVTSQLSVQIWKLPLGYVYPWVRVSNLYQQLVSPQESSFPVPNILAWLFLPNWSKVTTNAFPLRMLLALRVSLRLQGTMRWSHRGKRRKEYRIWEIFSSIPISNVNGYSYSWWGKTRTFQRWLREEWCSLVDQDHCWKSELVMTGILPSVAIADVWCHLLNYHRKEWLSSYRHLPTWTSSRWNLESH